MDRNNAVQVIIVVVDTVALRKESVDRNYYADKDCDWVRVSLSARRAWIEIVYPGTWSGSILSLSARRAWIEITHQQNPSKLAQSRSPQGERG